MNDELREWTNSAPFWEKHAETIRTMFSAVTPELIEDAGIIRGQRVLDVAGGAGEPALTMAGVVGPSGAVAYTDPIAQMMTAAQAAAQRRGITGARACRHVETQPRPAGHRLVAGARAGGRIARRAQRRCRIFLLRHGTGGRRHFGHRVARHRQPRSNRGV